jgi:hypothetical protein
MKRPSNEQAREAKKMKKIEQRTIQIQRHVDVDNEFQV